MLCSAVAVAYLLICLSIYLFISLSFCLSIFLSIYICLSIYLSVCLSVCPSVCLSVSIYLSLSICLDLSVSIYLSRSICLDLSVYLSIYPSIYLSTCKFENAAILRDLLNFWIWQHQKRSNSARLPSKMESCSEAEVFCAFWLPYVLRATTACTFSTSQLPKVVRRWCVLYIVTLKCASRHNGAQFFISHMTTWLRTRRFSEPTFRPSGHKSLEKHSVSRLSYLFPHLSLLSSHSFSSLIFSLLLFSSLTLATSAFPSVHIVGSLTSKLPSINNLENIYRYTEILIVVSYNSII